MNPPLAFKWHISALLLSLWPVWRWYVAGTLDGSNDGWGLLAAATAMLLCWRARRGSHRPHALPAWPLLLPTLLLLAYLLATLAGLSPALRAIPAVLALAALASIGCFGRRIHLPLFALSLLALPLTASLQFYLGYPLRVLAGSMSVALLQLNGIAVVREGTLLNWSGQLISIDAPCSGVKMLWAAMYLTYTLTALHGFAPLKSMAAIALAVCTVVLANAIRAAALFYTESGIVHLPPWAHGAIGMIMFVATASVIVSAIQRLNHSAQHDAEKNGHANGLPQPQHIHMAKGAPT